MGAPPVLTLGDLVEIVRRHRTLALCCGATVAAVVLFLGLGRTAIYEATATIALDRTRRPTDIGTDAQLDPRMGLYEHDLLNTQRNILLSANLLRVALRTGGLTTNEAYVAVADPVEVLRERLSVTTSRDSWDLRISLRDEVPQRAEAGLQAILDAYQSRHLRAEQERADSAITFLADQVAESERGMVQARDAQQTYQRTRGLVVLEAERSMPAQRLQALNSKRVVIGQQIASLEILVAQINSIDAIPDQEQRLEKLLTLDLVNRHPTVMEQQKLLYQLRTQEALAREKYLDKHPRLIELRSQIAIKNAHLLTGIDAVRTGVLGDYDKLAAQMTNLAKELVQVETEFNAYREDLFTLQTMIIQTKAAEEQYSGLLRRLNEERVKQRLNTQQLSVIDSPRASARPVNIRTSLTLALAMVLGALSAVGVPLLVDFLSRRARDGDEIRALVGAPVLAELPFTSHLRPLGADGNPETHPKLAEAFRGLRTALRLTQRQEDGHGEILLVTSCDSGEGKSTTAARLAVSMAASGLKVLLVDGDLRNPAMSEQLGQVCDRGLSQLLAGEPGISPSATTYPNLDLLDAGAQVPNPGELLGSHCLPEWLQLCRAQYDCVIIDSPPLRWFADSLVLGTYADRLLLVVREGTTQRSSLAKVRTQLAPLDDKPLGVVLVGAPGALGTVPFYGPDRYRTRNSDSRVTQAVGVPPTQG